MRYGSKENGPDSMSEVLVAVVSPEDPFSPNGLLGTELAGPVLSVLQVCPFKKVVLICPADLGARAADCIEAIAQRHERTIVELAELPVADLGDPAALREGVVSLLPSLLSDGGVTLLAATAYPHLHGALLGLLAEGRFAARLIDVVRPAYPSSKAPVLRVLSDAFREPGQGAGGMVREPTAVYVHRQPATPGSVHPSPQSTSSGDAAQDVESVAARLGVVGEHPAMRTLLETIGAVAQHQVPILIQGETGTGKGLCARLVHALSPMRTGPYVAVNCGALPEQLIESQLFGHRQGAFTGATRDQAGKFEQADGGTLFLDEIGELPLRLQPKLLRVLEDGLVEPLGATNGRSVNVRIVAATNRDLRSAVAKGTFREDLYYRLAFAVVSIPSLRDRRSDIPALALQFLSRINASMKAPRALSASALDRLTRLSWQGNVRDLENVIGRSVLLCEKEVLKAEDLVVDDPMAMVSDGLVEPPVLGEGFDLEAYLGELRRILVQQALGVTDGNQRAAAAMLGVSRQAVSRFVKEKRDEGGG